MVRLTTDLRPTEPVYTVQYIDRYTLYPSRFLFCGELFSNFCNNVTKMLHFTYYYTVYTVQCSVQNMYNLYMYMFLPSFAKTFFVPPLCKNPFFRSPLMLWSTVKNNQSCIEWDHTMRCGRKNGAEGGEGRRGEDDEMVGKTLDYIYNSNKTLKFFYQSLD